MEARNTERQGARFGLPESFASTVPDSLEDSPGPASPKRKFKEAEATSGFSFLSRDQDTGSAVPSHQNASPAKGASASPFGKKPTYGGAAVLLGDVTQPALSPGRRTANSRSWRDGKGSSQAKCSRLANGNSFQAAIHQFEKQFSKPQGPVGLSSCESEPEKAKADFQAAAQAFDHEHGAPKAGKSPGLTMFEAKPATYWPPGMGQSSTSVPLGNGATPREQGGSQNGAAKAPPEAQSDETAMGSFQAQREQPSSSGSGSKSEPAAVPSFSFGSTAPGKRKLPADLERNPVSGTVEPESQAAGSKTTSLSESIEAMCLGTAAKKGKRENGTKATTPILKARPQPRWQAAACRVAPSILTAADDMPASSVSAESEGSPMECSPCGSAQTPFSAFRPGLKETPSRRGGRTRLSSTPTPAGSRARRKAGQEPLRAPPAVSGLEEEAETDADGIAVDLANSQPFATPSKPEAPSFEGLFAAKVGLDFAHEKCPPPENKSAAKGEQPSFVFSSPGGTAAPGPQADKSAPVKPESAGRTGLGSTLPGAKAKATKQRASPKRGKPVRQQPLRMNGQPLRSGVRRAAPVQEVSTAAAGEDPAGGAHTEKAGSKWEAFAADMRASRESGEGTAQPASAPEDLKTPQAAKFRAGSPGPVPMSGLSYSGPGPSSPSPEDLPRPADGLFSASCQDEAGQSKAPKAADRGPFGATSDVRAASNPFRGWTSRCASGARPAPFQSLGSGASTEAFVGFSARPLPAERPVPVQQSVPAPALGAQQPAGMTPGRKDGKLRESKSARRKNLTALHKEGAQGDVNAQNQDPNIPSSGMDARPGAEPSAQQLEEAVARDAAQQLRAQANEMHSRGDYNRAIRLYKEAIVKLQAAGLTAETAVLFSNLAATSLQTNRPAAALHYSHRALAADATFFKAHLRAGTAYWRLGNLESAGEQYRKAARQSGAPQQEIMEQLEMLAAFRRRTEQAFAAFEAGGSPEGLQKLLVDNVLLLLKEAPGSQQLLSLQAHILLRIGRLSEAAQVAERHTIPAESGLPLPTWPWYIKVQAAFLQGDLEKSADLIEQELQRVEGGVDRVLTVDGGFQADVTDLAAAASGMRELVLLKEAGNKFQRQRSFEAAIEKYTSALAGARSPPPAFAAVLHANRAASHQAKGNYAEALADSLRATALDPSYAKAHSRAAALLADCGLLDAAVRSLEELQRVLGPLAPASKEVAQRLTAARASARRKPAADHYKLLGLQRRCQADEVRKVYKKLALKLHPDKALAQCKFSTSVIPSAQGPATIAELEAAVRDKANWLFQLVGDANAVLANPQSRQKYDSDLAYEERMSSGWQSSPVRGYTAQAYERHSSYSFNRRWERSQWRAESDSDSEDFHSDFSRRYNYA